MSKKEQSFQDTPVPSLYQAHPRDKEKISPLFTKVTEKELSSIKVRCFHNGTPVEERWGVTYGDTLAITSAGDHRNGMGCYGIVHLPTGYMVAVVDYLFEAVSLRLCLHQLLQDCGRRFLDSAEFTPRNKARMEAAVYAWHTFIQKPMRAYIEEFFPDITEIATAQTKERLIELVIYRVQGNLMVSQLDECLIEQFQELAKNEEDPIIKRAANPRPGDIYELGLLRFQVVCVSFLDDGSQREVITLKDLTVPLAKNNPEFLTIRMMDFNENSKLGERKWKLVQESNQS
jgi:hypothetical protein